MELSTRIEHLLPKLRKMQLPETHEARTIIMELLEEKAKLERTFNDRMVSTMKTVNERLDLEAARLTWLLNFLTGCRAGADEADVIELFWLGEFTREQLDEAIEGEDA